MIAKIAVPHHEDNDLLLNDSCFVHFDPEKSSDLLQLLLDFEGDTSADWYGLMGPNYYLRFKLGQASAKEKIRSKEYLTASCVNRFGFHKDAIYKWFIYASMLCGQPRRVSIGQAPRIFPSSVKSYFRSRLGKDDFLRLTYAVKKCGQDFEQDLNTVLNANVFPPALTFVMKRELFRAYMSCLKKCLQDLDGDCASDGFLDSEGRELLARLLLAVFQEHLVRQSPEKVIRLPLVHFYKTARFVEPLPVFEQDVIPIAAAASSAYIPYFSVLLQSIIDHSSPDHNYDIFLLTRNVSQENKSALLQQLDGRNNFSLRLVDPGPLIKVKDFTVGSYHALESYYKLYAPWIFAKYQKIIVLDCDMLAMTDVAELMDEDLHGNPIGAVTDHPFCSRMKTESDTRNYVAYEVGLSDPFAYANSGTLLMDLALIRAELLQTQCTDCCMRCHRRLEQDTLNKLYHNRIKFIDDAWNVFVGDETEKEIKKPKIVHYSGENKPQKIENAVYAQEFWSCAKKTSFYQQLSLQQSDRGDQNSPICDRSDKAQGRLLTRGQFLPMLDMTLTLAKEKRKRSSDGDYRGDYKIENIERIQRQYVQLYKHQLEMRIPGTFAYENRKRILALKNIHKGQRAFLIGHGPSLRLEDLERLHDEITFSVNDTYRLYEKTDWRLKYYLYDQNLFFGKKLTDDKRLYDYLTGSGEVCFFPLDESSPEVAKILPNAVFLPIIENWEVFRHTQRSFYNFSKNIADVVYTSGTSMYVNMQIATYMGISEFYIIGADSRYKPDKLHVYDDEGKSIYKTAGQESLLIGAGFLAMKRAAAKNGIKLFNATRGGYLEYIQRKDFDSLF